MAAPIAYGADWSDNQIYGPALVAPVNDKPDGSGTWYRLSFTLRYADFPGQGHAVLTRAEYESHLAAGLRSMLIYQRTTRDPDGGEARGREYGRAAVAYARHIGYRAGEPIFATADAPIGSYNLDVAEAFFRGFAAEVRAGGYRAGGYGFRDVIYRLQDRAVVDVLWLCGAESGWRPGIALYQFNNGRIYPPGVADADLNKQFEKIPGGDDVNLTDPIEDPNWSGDPAIPRFFEVQDWLRYANIKAGKAADAAKQAAADAAVIRADVAELKASGVPVALVLSPEDKAEIIAGVLDGMDARNRDGDPSTGTPS